MIKWRASLGRPPDQTDECFDNADTILQNSGASPYGAGTATDNHAGGNLTFEKDVGVVGT